VGRLPCPLQFTDIKVHNVPPKQKVI
jgi:hypothetical protein